MVTCTDYDKGQNSAQFYVDTVDELSDLPNIDEKGKNNLKNMMPVIAGSTAVCKNGNIYILSGDNSWEIFA